MHTLITNSTRGNLLTELTQSLETCHRFYFNVAFVNFSGLQLLLDSFKACEEKNVKGKIITGTYLNFTDPYALKRLTDFHTIETKIFVTNKNIGFHPKAYIFEYETYFKFIVGSSNLTQSALKSNIEWNLQVIAKDTLSDKELIEDVFDAYHALWAVSEQLDSDFLTTYTSFIEERKSKFLVNEPNVVFQFTRDPAIQPNMLQQQAMEKLAYLRKKNQTKALVVAATGTGKTYMSAFDVKQVQPDRLLFLVHRGEIIEKAKESFEQVINLKHKDVGLLSGRHKETEADYLFSTIQTMSRTYDEYERNHFDYIIVDEAHHATSESYQRVLDYFQPSFLLGMTATPERSDNGNVFDVFDNNLPVDIRLREALEHDLLVPFHYFGITDASGVDLSNADTLTPSQLAEKLSVNQRVDFIVNKMKFYGHDGEKRKALGFCVTIEHAKFMAAEFTKRGVKSTYLYGQSSMEDRVSTIQMLESDTSDLEVIFTVDIFNEGIDIPGINLVLMLRPTESPIVFTQQLGRGLRKQENKHFLTVLDFIGNYSKSFLIAIALNGSRYSDKKSISREVQNGFKNIPGASHISLDKLSREQILKQLERENFYSWSYLKEDYHQFKQALGGKVPWFLYEYLKVEYSPDPVQFFDKSISSTNSRNYLQFLSKVEPNSIYLNELTNDDTLMDVLTELSSHLPLKRPYDFATIEAAMDKDTLTVADVCETVSRYVSQVNTSSALHALETWSGKYFDQKEKKKESLLVQTSPNTFKRSDMFSTVLQNAKHREHVEDTLHYGLIRYEEEFGMDDYGTPFLKLYQEYSQREVGLMANYQQTHSAFRGSTLQERKGGDHYFLFIDLHKEEDIDERINYNDQFISRTQFQWESPNTTTQDSERGKDLTQSKERQKTIHLFVRKYKMVNNVTQKYMYIGTGESLSYKNEKPIEIQYVLKNKVPQDLYEEFKQTIAMSVGL